MQADDNSLFHHHVGVLGDELPARRQHLLAPLLVRDGALEVLRDQAARDVPAPRREGSADMMSTGTNQTGRLCRCRVFEQPREGGPPATHQKLPLPALSPSAICSSNAAMCTACDNGMGYLGR